jgi:hypothetical protein
MLCNLTSWKQHRLSTFSTAHIPFSPINDCFSPALSPHQLSVCSEDNRTIMWKLKCAVQTYAWGKTGGTSEVAQLTSAGDSSFRIDPNANYAEVSAPMIAFVRIFIASCGWARTPRARVHWRTTDNHCVHRWWRGIGDEYHTCISHGISLLCPLTPVYAFRIRMAHIAQTHTRQSTTGAHYQ